MSLVEVSGRPIGLKPSIYEADKTLVRMLGQAIGPSFGGILTQYLGFRSIFYFLFILGSIALTAIVVLLPETLRNLAGNGSIALHGWHRPLTYRIIGLPEPVLELNPQDLHRKKLSWRAMLVSPVRMLCEKDVFVTLLFGSVVYAVWSMVTASTTRLFQSRYHLNDMTVGFAYLPNGQSQDALRLSNALCNG